MTNVLSEHNNSVIITGLKVLHYYGTLTTRLSYTSQAGYNVQLILHADQAP